MSIERIKDRIRKLLNTAADDAATEGEVDNALRAARALLFAHHLEESDLEEDEERGVTFGRSKVHETHRKTAFWQGQLAQFIGRFIGSVDCYRDQEELVRNERGHAEREADGSPKYRRTIVFYGPAEDCLLACELYGDLLLTIAGMAELKWGSQWTIPGREYCEGFVQGLNERVKKADAQLSNDAQSRALVVRSNQALVELRENAKRWLEEETGCRLRKVSRRRTARHDAEARAEGRADGRQTDVSAERKSKLAGRPQGRLGHKE